MDSVTKESSGSKDNLHFPPYPYVPARGPKYSDTDYSFEQIEASVTPEIPVEELSKTLAFKAGCAFFENGFYWECHQALDPVWIHTKDPSPERDIVLALIQLANARLKLSSGRPNSAWRLCDMVEAHLSRCPTDRAILGLWVSDLMEKTAETRQMAKHSL